MLTDLIEYLRASPTPFHAAAEAERRLLRAGFSRLELDDSWAGLPPGAYVVPVLGSALFAFVLPESRAVDAFRIIGAHTDSPNLRLKPKAAYVQEGYGQLAVEVYGGALGNSWLDRDLALAGRAIVREEGRDVERLVVLERPILRVAQLAIHLDREVNDKGLILNRSQHLPPIVGLYDAPPDLEQLLARALSVTPEAILGHELMLFDTQPPCRGGQDGELLFSARLDNLAMCHAATMAIGHSLAALHGARHVSIVSLFDHEEVGSQSATGAESSALPRVLGRIAETCGLPPDDLHRAYARSVCLSADMAHAVHPNYADRHDPRNKPRIGKGAVLKHNSNQRYATTARGAALISRLCEKEGLSLQTYSHRADLPCGSTIGPITSALLGIPTIDIGNPMLSMHSCREAAGSLDHEPMIRLMGAFLREGP